MSLAHTEPESFAEELDDWLSRSPFLAIALFVHLIAFFALNAIPWDLFGEEEPNVVVGLLPAPPTEIVEYEEPSPDPEILDPEPVVDPEVVEALVEAEADSNETFESEFANPSPFADSTTPNTMAGLGGGGGDPSGKLGKRTDKVGHLPRDLHEAIFAGLDWLADHQSPNGSWEARDFATNCDREGAEVLANGRGDALHDTGVTALALLAFLGVGQTQDSGAYQHVVRAGLGWLAAQQDDDSGLVGPSTAKEFLYDHAIATLALAEAFESAGDPLSRKRAQRAVDFCIDAQNPYSGWRYDVPPDGSSDTSVTGWMVLALAVAQEGGLRVGTGTFEGALAWLDEVTDPADGRVGYMRRGQGSSRLARQDVTYPPELSEALTGVGVLSRVFVHGLHGTDPADDELVQLGAERLLEHLPAWDAHGGSGGDSRWAEGDAGATNDMYAWYASSYALHQLGGREWDRWRRELEPLLLANQRTSPPCLRGSWDPGGPWGSVGGRVYSTAILLLCLETTVRYERR